MPKFFARTPSKGVFERVCLLFLLSRVFFMSPYWWCFRYNCKAFRGRIILLVCIKNWLRKLVDVVDNLSDVARSTHLKGIGELY